MNKYRVVTDGAEFKIQELVTTKFIFFSCEPYWTDRVSYDGYVYYCKRFYSITEAQTFCDSLNREERNEWTPI